MFHLEQSFPSNPRTTPRWRFVSYLLVKFSSNGIWHARVSSFITPRLGLHMSKEYNLFGLSTNVAVKTWDVVLLVGS